MYVLILLLMFYISLKNVYIFWHARTLLTYVCIHHSKSMYGYTIQKVCINTIFKKYIRYSFKKYIQVSFTD